MDKNLSNVPTLKISSTNIYELIQKIQSKTSSSTYKSSKQLEGIFSSCINEGFIIFSKYIL